MKRLTEKQKRDLENNLATGIATVGYEAVTIKDNLFTVLGIGWRSLSKARKVMTAMDAPKPKRRVKRKTNTKK